MTHTHTCRERTFEGIPGTLPIGMLIHKACGALLIVYAVARLCSRFDVCAKALYYASYLFFYGQNGFMNIFGGYKEEPPRIDDTAYVLYVLCLATLMQTLTEVGQVECS